MFDLSAYTSAAGGASGILNIASTLFNVFGSVSTSNQRGELYDYEARRAAEVGRMDAEIGQVQAGRLRSKGKDDIAHATAQYGASGVDVGSGSPTQVVGELNRRIELDALSAMLAGRYKAYDKNVEAAGYTAAGENARSSGWWGAGASLLGGFARAQAVSGWGRSSSSASGIGHAQNLGYAEGAFAGE